MLDETKLLKRITVNPNIFGGKPIVRERRLAVEHVLGMLAAGDTPETLLAGYPGWSEKIYRLAWFTPDVLSGMSALNRSAWRLRHEASPVNFP